jgi:hypothetical protein
MSLTAAEINYCRADNSDPFTARRIVAHKLAGLDGYEATEHWETEHLPEGQFLSNGATVYQRRTYRNGKRP